MTPKPCLPFIFILSSLPLVSVLFVFFYPLLTACITPSLTHSLIDTLLPYLTSSLTDSHPHSLTHSLTHSHIHPTRKHTRDHSSAPEGSNRRYVSVSLPSPRPHVSLQQISGQRCRKPRFWRRKRRTKVCVCVCVWETKRERERERERWGLVAF